LDHTEPLARGYGALPETSTLPDAPPLHKIPLTRLHLALSKRRVGTTEIDSPVRVRSQRYF
jgi:hypothetical protein